MAQRRMQMKWSLHENVVMDKLDKILKGGHIADVTTGSRALACYITGNELPHPGTSGDTASMGPGKS